MRIPYSLFNVGLHPKQTVVPPEILARLAGSPEKYQSSLKKYQWSWTARTSFKSGPTSDGIGTERMGRGRGASCGIDLAQISLGVEGQSSELPVCAVAGKKKESKACDASTLGFTPIDKPPIPVHRYTMAKKRAREADGQPAEKRKPDKTDEDSEDDGVNTRRAISQKEGGIVAFGLLVANSRKTGALPRISMS